MFVLDSSDFKCHFSQSRITQSGPTLKVTITMLLALRCRRQFGSTFLPYRKVLRPELSTHLIIFLRCDWISLMMMMMQHVSWERSLPLQDLPQKCHSSKTVQKTRTELLMVYSIKGLFTHCIIIHWIGSVCPIFFGTFNAGNSWNDIIHYLWGKRETTTEAPWALFCVFLIYIFRALFPRQPHLCPFCRHFKGLALSLDITRSKCLVSRHKAQQNKSDMLLLQIIHWCILPQTLGTIVVRKSVKETPMLFLFPIETTEFVVGHIARGGIQASVWRNGSSHNGNSHKWWPGKSGRLWPSEQINGSDF